MFWLLFDSFLAHNLHCHLFAGVDHLRFEHGPEGAMSELLTETIAALEVVFVFQLLQVFHVQGPRILNGRSRGCANPAADGLGLQKLAAE